MQFLHLELSLKFKKAKINIRSQVMSWLDYKLKFLLFGALMVVIIDI
jgi:hypothetical protein